MDATGANIYRRGKMDKKKKNEVLGQSEDPTGRDGRNEALIIT